MKKKFKVGDWVVNKLGESWHIDSFDKKNYQVSDGKGNYNYFPIAKQDAMHLWTIKDAKDGDILVGSKKDVILIFRGIGNTEWDDVIDYHCYYDCYHEDFIVQDDVEYWGNIENNQLEPATKEQRDILEKAIADAEYTFDFEKKELKIEQNPWSEEDEKIN